MPGGVTGALGADTGLVPERICRRDGKGIGRAVHQAAD